MSKAVRIREHLYEEIAKRAKEERRSILNQLEVLLEQALALDEPETIMVQAVVGGQDVGKPQPVKNPRRSAAPDEPHFKPDFK